LDGVPPGGQLDFSLPGFGPFGTAGAHCFDPDFGTYRRIVALAAIRRVFPVLRVGRQYPRPTSIFGRPFTMRGPGEIVAWSRILSDEEAVCVVNAHGNEVRGGDVLIDASLNPPGTELTVVANTSEAARGTSAGVAHAVGSRLSVKQRDGIAYVEIRDVPPSEVVVLVNHP
jgi:hypothetical protein